MSTPKIIKIWSIKNLWIRRNLRLRVKKILDLKSDAGGNGEISGWDPKYLGQRKGLGGAKSDGLAEKNLSKTKSVRTSSRPTYMGSGILRKGWVAGKVGCSG